MADLYTNLITRVNKAIDPVEHGGVTIKEAEKATTADSAGKATTAKQANTASVVKTAESPLLVSAKITNGDSDGCVIGEGVYLVVYQGEYAGRTHQLCGVLVVKAGVSSSCRIAQRNNAKRGGTLQYNPESSYLWLSYSGGSSEVNTTDSSGTAHFFKFGTLQEV